MDKSSIKVIDNCIRFYHHGFVSMRTQLKQTDRKLIKNPIPVRIFDDNKTAIDGLHNSTSIAATTLIRMAVDLGMPLLSKKLEANGKAKE